MVVVSIGLSVTSVSSAIHTRKCRITCLFAMIIGKDGLRHASMEASGIATTNCSRIRLGFGTDTIRISTTKVGGRSTAERRALWRGFPKPLRSEHGALRRGQARQGLRHGLEEGQQVRGVRLGMAHRHLASAGPPPRR